MDRRRFVGGVALGLVVAPLAAHAQQAAKVPRVGLLSVPPFESAEMQALLDAFRRDCANAAMWKDRTSSSNTDPRAGRLSKSPAWRANWFA